MTAEQPGATRSSAPRRALCLLNPKAKSGGADLAEVFAQLAAGGVTAEPLVSQSLEAARAKLREQAARCDLIVVGGGDGTLSDLADVLLEAGKPVGLLPLGTANDLARSVEIPTDPAAAAALILAGHSAPIDIGTVNGRPFLNVASLGLSADVARFHKGARKRWLGVLAYPLSWWDAWRARRPFAARLTIDGKERRVRCAQFAIGSGRYYGGGLTLDETASHFDGLLHGYYIEPLRLGGWLRLLPALFLGRLRRQPEAVTFEARQVELTTPRRLAVNVDGELAAHTPASFAIRPGALRLFVPADGARPPGTARREGDEAAAR